MCIASGGVQNIFDRGQDMKVLVGAIRSTVCRFVCFCFDLILEKKPFARSG